VLQIIENSTQRADVAPGRPREVTNRVTLDDAMPRPASRPNCPASTGKKVSFSKKLTRDFVAPIIQVGEQITTQPALAS